MGREVKLYGVPYQGSKNKIAEWVVKHLPAGEVFVDLFAGGCAVTHAAMLSGKWKRFIVNDICDAPKLFVDAVNGKYKNEKRWISREDFFALKDTDPYVRCLWCFGNDCRSYMYAEELEPWKKALHYACVLGDYSLLNVMDIYPPACDIPLEMANDRKIFIGGWCMQHKDDVKTKYIKHWLSLVDEKKRQYEEIYGYVLRGDDICKKVTEESERLRQYLITALKDSGLTQAEVGRRLNTQMQGHYFGRSQWECPTYSEYTKMQEFMPLLKEDYYTLTQYYTIIKRLQSLQSLQRLQRLQSLQRLESLQRLQRLQSLQRLESLQSLQSLQSLESMEVHKGDYRELVIPKNAVVYCDIPYKGTKGYNGEAFSHDEFYKWASEKDCYISEYSAPNTYERVACIHKRSLMSGKGNGALKEEGIFVRKGCEAHKKVIACRHKEHKQLTMQF